MLLDCQIFGTQLRIVQDFFGKTIVNDTAGIKDHGTIGQPQRAHGVLFYEDRSNPL